jgi:hypothetical protein
MAVSPFFLTIVIVDIEQSKKVQASALALQDLQSSNKAGATRVAPGEFLGDFRGYSLKVVISQRPIIAARAQATLLETGAWNRMGTDHSCPVSQPGAFDREQCEHRV